MPLRDLPDVITVEEAAAVLRIGRTVAYEQAHRWRATGGREGLPVLTLGRRLLVPRAGLERMLGADPVGSGQRERENDQDPGEGRSTPGAVSVESGHGDPASPHVELPSSAEVLPPEALHLTDPTQLSLFNPESPTPEPSR